MCVGFSELVDYSVLHVLPLSPAALRHAHALGALTAFCCTWLPQYYLASLRQPTRAEFTDAGPLIQSLCELAIPLMSRQVHMYKCVCLCVHHILLSLIVKTHNVDL